MTFAPMMLLLLDGTPKPTMSFDSGDVVIVVGAIGVVITNVIAALRQGKAIAEVSAKADVITTHVNSATAAAKAEIVSLREQVTSLVAQLEAADKRAALLAQAVTERIVVMSSPISTPKPTPKR